MNEAATSSQRLAQTCYCCAVRSDGNELAIGGSGNDVLVFQRSSSSQSGGERPATWRQVARLEGHEAAVSGLEYFEAAGDEGEQQSQQRLASASHDRNAFIWEQGRDGDSGHRPAADEQAGISGRNGSVRGGDGGSLWRAGELVVTKLGRGATALALAPGGAKLAIGASDGLLSVCYWDQGRRLFAPKLVCGRHKAAVLALAWHPSGAALATAGADGRLRVLTGILPAVDGAREPPPAATRRLGDVLLETELPGGWGLALAFSPGGATLAAASQGSTLTLLSGIDLAEEATWRAAAGRQQTLPLPGLPLKALAFLGDGLLVGGGFDCRPLVFRRDPGTGAWAFDRHLQGLRPGSAAGGRLADRVKLFEAAQVAAAEGGSGGKKRSRGGEPKGGGDGGLVHANCIVAVRPLPSAGAAGGVARFLTAGLDGRVVEWEVER